MEIQLNAFSQQYSNFDVKMAWDIKIIDGYTVVDGFFKNVRYATMEEIEIWVALRDAHGKTTHRAVCLVTPSRLDRDVAATFRVMLPSFPLQ